MASEGGSMNYKKIAISNIGKTGNSFCFSAHFYENLYEVENVLRELNVGRDRLDAPSDIKEGDMVAAARFSVDTQWYRAKVESVKVESERVVEADVLIVDFGNRETISYSDIAVLPSSLSSLPPYANEYTLAFVTVPSDKDYAMFARGEIGLLLSCSSSVEVQTVDSVDGIELSQVIVRIDGKSVDVAEALIEKGVAHAEKRDGEKNETIQKLVTAYGVAEEKARMDGVNIWAFDGLNEPEKEERKQAELTKAYKIRFEQYTRNTRV